MFHVIFVVVLLYVGVTSWKRAQKDTFISLKDDSGVCTEVSRSVSALYSATVDGYWSSQSGFRYNQTSYFMQIEDFIGGLDGYEDVMRRTLVNLLPSVLRGYNRGLPWNMILWAVFVYKEPSFAFYSAGDAYTIFHNDFYGAAIFNRDGVCFDGQSKTSFAAETFSIDMVLPNYMLNETCKDKFDPRNLNWDPRSDLYNFIVKMDVRRYTRSSLCAISCQ
jgi:hypothetical protein